MSESITTYTGMFRGNDISPADAVDVQGLLVSVEASLTTVTAAVTNAEAAADAALATASATAAAAATAQANLASTAAAAEANLTASAATVTALVGTVTGSAAAAAASATAAAASQSTASAAAVTATSNATASGTSATAAAAAQTVAVNAGTAAVNQVILATSQATAAAASAATALAASAVSVSNVGRNKVHNGLFTIAQRGGGPFVSSGYTLDRWSLTSAHTGGGSASVTQGAVTTAVATLIGDEEAESNVNLTFTGGSSAGDFDTFSQLIEDVRRLSGKTVTVSFWAVAALGAPKIGLELAQLFGSGGSPSPGVFGIGSQAFQLSTTWTRYSATIALPVVAGKTLGTSGGHSTDLIFWLSAGSSNASRSGNIGVQAASVFLWGVQLEIGTTASVLEKPDPAAQLTQCQRFYQTTGGVASGYGATGQTAFQPVPLLGTMRAAPTVVVNASGGSNYTSVSAVASVSAVTLEALVTATGQAAFNFTFTASADL